MKSLECSEKALLIMTELNTHFQGTAEDRFELINECIKLLEKERDYYEMFRMQ